MSRARKATILICALIVLGTVTGAAGAPRSVSSGGRAAVLDCKANGRLTGHYTAEQLRFASSHMPSEVVEYTNCQDVIGQQLDSVLAAPMKAGAAASGDSAFPTWLLVLLVLLVLLGAGGSVVAYRRGDESSDRRGRSSRDGEPPRDGLIL